MFSRMPVSAWGSDMVFVDEPLDTTTVVSDDIWKKFDLDVPLENYHHRYQNDFLEDPSALSSVPPAHCETLMMMHFDKLNCQASREIRHHDCMWAGLCISKEHNRTHPAKKDSQIQRRIPAGRSVLIPKVNGQQQQQQQQQPPSGLHLAQLQHHQQQRTGFWGRQGRGGALATTTTAGAVKASFAHSRQQHLESDGGSSRPETPQSSESESESDEEDEEEEEEEEEEEDEEDNGEEAPVFRHEQISLNDIVSMPVSEVTGQQVQRRPALYDRRKEDERTTGFASRESAMRSTTMSDHCYHLNQQTMSKKLEHLGVQTPSDSEEEIDVVSYEKPTRPTSTAAASLPTYPSPAEQQHFQLTVKTAFKDRHQQQQQQQQPQQQQQQQQSSNATTTPAVATPPPTAPRPRGRPPNSANRKRAAAAAASQAATTAHDPPGRPAAKRARQSRAYQRRVSPQKPIAKSSPLASPSKSSFASSSSRSSSDEEPDTEKRSLHNNMERQRRIELRNAFEDLRVLVPEVEAKEKAPKVAILRQAASFCDRLTDLEQLNQAMVKELKRKQERLRGQLSQLRRSLALQR